MVVQVVPVEIEIRPVAVVALAVLFILKMLTYLREAKR